MENALIGADIMPAATHLTASYAFERPPDGDVREHADPHDALRPAGQGGGDAIAIGSLDLIESDTMLSLFSTGPQIVSGTGEDEAATRLPWSSCCQWPRRTS